MAQRIRAAAVRMVARAMRPWVDVHKDPRAAHFYTVKEYTALREAAEEAKRAAVQAHTYTYLRTRMLERWAGNVKPRAPAQEYGGLSAPVFHAFHGSIALLPVLLVYLWAQTIDEDEVRAFRTSELTNKAVLDKRLQILEQQLGISRTAEQESAAARAAAEKSEWSVGKAVRSMTEWLPSVPRQHMNQELMSKLDAELQQARVGARAAAVGAHAPAASTLVSSSCNAARASPHPASNAAAPVLPRTTDGGLADSSYSDSPVEMVHAHVAHTVLELEARVRQLEAALTALAPASDAGGAALDECTEVGASQRGAAAEVTPPAHTPSG